ncbi:MAG TPA: hypothetical protein VIT64_10080 [Ilumatobacteraceae bacterium]
MRNVVRLVFGRRLQGQQTAKLAFHFSAIAAGLTQEDENLAVVVSSGPLTDASTTDRVGGVDSCVYGQAARGNEATDCKLIDRSIGKLLRLAGVGADLCGADWACAQRPRH